MASAIALTQPVARVDRSNPRRARFVFVRTAALDNMVEKFWRDELQVSARSYANQLRALKARLYE